MELTSLAPSDLLRILCGVWFAPHCVGKLRNVGPASQTFDKAGFRPGRAFVYITIALELVAGAGLVTGVFAPAAAALAVVVLAGASYAVVKINGFNWRWQKQGPEFMVFWAVVCVLSVARW